MSYIAGALSIDGWMTKEELGWLGDRAAEHKVIVEIGSFLGRSTRVLGDNTKGRVYAVDDWVGPRETIFENDQVTRKYFMGMFLKNMWGLRDRVIPVRVDHAKASVPETPDMVFIDGDHNYENVHRDIEMWKERLAPGGLLCGHDYPDYHGVERAVQELVQDFKVAPGTTIWYSTV
jgi:hypothetical protein